MRRGHSGKGGWRSSGPRHFSPWLEGNNPNFRNPRPPMLHMGPRFPPLIPPPNRPPPPFRGHHNFSPHKHDYNERNRFPKKHHSDSQMHYHQNHKEMNQSNEISSFQNDIEGGNHYSFKKRKELCDRDSYEDKEGQDDHLHYPSRYPRKPINDYPNHQNIYERRQNFVQPEIQNIEKNTSTHGVSGHRPSSSDYYVRNPEPITDNSDTFSRSIDDTVDIIKKRLLNRRESQGQAIPAIVSDGYRDNERTNTSHMDSYHDISRLETTPKKKTTKQKFNINENCNKLKNKIIQQLFKMDKDAIHKMMDNPSSSTKFEYALNSLVTESQNSLNRQLRAKAEKSLYGKDNYQCGHVDTIYEDTFMKQMQCVLDPQDTIILADLKPIVMAELNKVLCLDEYSTYNQEHYGDEEDDYNHSVNQCNELENIKTEESTPQLPYQSHSHNPFSHQQNIPKSTTNYLKNMVYDNIIEPQSNIHPKEKSHQTKTSEVDKYRRENLDERLKHLQGDSRFNEFYQNYDDAIENKSDSPKSSKCHNRRHSTPEKQHHTKQNYDNVDINSRRFSASPVHYNAPYLDNSDQTAEDDTFDELDKQYHVSVDPDFNIDAIETASPEWIPPSIDSPPKNVETRARKSVETELPPVQILQGNDVKAEILDFVNSMTNLEEDEEAYDDKRNISESNSKIDLNENEEILTDVNIKESESKITDERDIKTENIVVHPNDKENVTTQKESIEQSSNKKSQKDISHYLNSSKSSSGLNSNCSSSRKRPIKEHPSHRKEKRKKSDNSSIESSKHILNKNIIINVNDCPSITKDKCETNTKSVFNLFFSKSQNKSDTMKDKLGKKPYSDKYVKRKETKKLKDVAANKEVESKHSSTNPTSVKSEKCKLKTINMFKDQPKKSQLHQTQKSTILDNDNKNKLVTKTSVPTRDQPKVLRSVSTQVHKKVHTKETQTSNISLKHEMTSKFTQTSPFDEKEVTPADVFERMKEIDMEIQQLLQEKFKLYNSLESKENCPKDMQNLGMTVLNVPYLATKPEDVTQDDNILANFAKLSEEELENIALEGINNENHLIDVNSTKESKRKSKKSAVPKVTKVQTPIIKSKRILHKKSKEPNISLIEQIIQDDRDLEDIISLNELEESPKITKKNQKHSKNKKKLRHIDISKYDIKQCYVLLTRLESKDLNKELKTEITSTAQNSDDVDIPLYNNKKLDNTDTQPGYPNIDNDIPVLQSEIHFQDDMMYISEDIVIDVNSEIGQSLDAKDITQRDNLLINDEAVVDNSDKSVLPSVESTPAVNIYKTYDYSGDELINDSISVSGHTDAVLAIEALEPNFLAACLDGNVYHFNGEGHLLTTLKGSNFAVTCLNIVEEKYGTTVYTGSLDSRIRYYDLETGLEKGPECNVLSPIQTMDRAWDTIFVGTRTGFVLQFECKNNMLIPVSTIKFSDQSILALRALKEGPRKVLLVAARSENVTIKDAQTGLLLRTLVGPKMTVYTLLYEEGKVYCGTSSNQIQTFDYASGTHIGEHESGKGAVCLRAAGGLLFAGCYDGCVYVYRNGECKPLAQLRGPAVMLLSLTLLGNKIIAGYKDRSLYIWKIPVNILEEMVL